LSTNDVKPEKQSTDASPHIFLFVVVVVSGREGRTFTTPLTMVMVVVMVVGGVGLKSTAPLRPQLTPPHFSLTG